MFSKIVTPCFQIGHFLLSDLFLFVLRFLFFILSLSCSLLPLFVFFTSISQLSIFASHVLRFHYLCSQTYFLLFSDFSFSKISQLLFLSYLILFLYVSLFLDFSLFVNQFSKFTWLTSEFQISFFMFSNWPLAFHSLPTPFLFFLFQFISDLIIIFVNSLISLFCFQGSKSLFISI